MQSTFLVRHEPAISLSVVKPEEPSDEHLFIDNTTRKTNLMFFNRYSQQTTALTNDNVHHSCTQCICRECPHSTILRRTNTLRCQGSLICPKRSRPRLVGTYPLLLPSSHQLDSMQRRICIQILLIVCREYRKNFKKKKTQK